MKFFALIFGEGVWTVYSSLIAVILRFRGARVGKKFIIKGTPRLALSGKKDSLIIGDCVTIAGDVDIRTRENGRIIIGNDCKIDQGVRMIAANDASLKLGDSSYIGFYSVLNCGADVTMGEYVLMSGFCYIQSSNHGIERGVRIRQQKNMYSPVSIGDDVWMGSHVSVLAGASIESGAVIGSKAVVNGSIGENAVAVGVPAKVIRYRESENVSG